jgi:hypothetical protein
MMPTPLFLRSALHLCVAVAWQLAPVHAAEPVRIVLQNGRMIPLTSLALQGTNLTLVGPLEGFTAGQVFPLESVDHVFGDKPVELSLAIALLLSDKPANALKLLDPILTSQRVSAKISGNFWLEAARASLLAHALMGNSPKCSEIGKEIAEATPQPGSEPFEALGKVLLLPSTTPPETRETAFSDLILNQLPADVSGYAAYFRGNSLKASKKTAAALESYLMVTGLYSSGNITLNAAAELKASEILAASPDRREEAVALLNSCVAYAPGTVLASEATTRLGSLK